MYLIKNIPDPAFLPPDLPDFENLPGLLKLGYPSKMFEPGFLRFCRITRDITPGIFPFLLITHHSSLIGFRNDYRREDTDNSSAIMIGLLQHLGYTNRKMGLFLLHQHKSLNRDLQDYRDITPGIFPSSYSLLITHHSSLITLSLFTATACCLPVSPTTPLRRRCVC